jgi:hypothetical protein
LDYSDSYQCADTSSSSPHMIYQVSFSFTDCAGFMHGIGIILLMQALVTAISSLAFILPLTENSINTLKHGMSVLSVILFVTVGIYCLIWILKLLRDTDNSALPLLWVSFFLAYSVLTQILGQLMLRGLFNQFPANYFIAELFVSLLFPAFPLFILSKIIPVRKYSVPCICMLFASLLLYLAQISICAAALQHFFRILSPIIAAVSSFYISKTLSEIPSSACTPNEHTALIEKTIRKGFFDLSECSSYLIQIALIFLLYDVPHFVNTISVIFAANFQRFSLYSAIMYDNTYKTLQGCWWIVPFSLSLAAHLYHRRKLKHRDPSFRNSMLSISAIYTLAFPLICFAAFLFSMFTSYASDYPAYADFVTRLIPLFLLLLESFCLSAHKISPMQWAALLLGLCLNAVALILQPTNYFSQPSAQITLAVQDLCYLYHSFLLMITAIKSKH